MTELPSKREYRRALLHPESFEYVHNESTYRLTLLEIAAFEELKEKQIVSAEDLKRTMIRKDIPGDNPNNNILNNRLIKTLGGLQTKLGPDVFSYTIQRARNPETKKVTSYYRLGEDQKVEEPDESSSDSNPNEKRVHVVNSHQWYPRFDTPQRNKSKEDAPEPSLKNAQEGDWKRAIDTAPPSQRGALTAMLNNDGIRPSPLDAVLKSQGMSLEQFRHVAEDNGIRLRIFPNGTFRRVTI